MFVGPVHIISRLDGQSKFQMFILFCGRHVGGTQRSTNMAAPYWAPYCKFAQNIRRISEVWENAETSNLEKYLLYLSPISWMNRIIFRCVAFKIIYWLKLNLRVSGESVPSCRNVSLMVLVSFSDWQCFFRNSLPGWDVNPLQGSSLPPSSILQIRRWPFISLDRVGILFQFWG